jgi:hypothetical protein
MSVFQHVARVNAIDCTFNVVGGNQIVQQFAREALSFIYTSTFILNSHSTALDVNCPVVLAGVHNRLRDISAVTDLALKIANTLSDDTGSAAEYQELIIGLRSISQEFEQMDSLLHAANLSSNRDIANFISSETLLCHSALQSFWKTVKLHREAHDSKPVRQFCCAIWVIIWAKIWGIKAWWKAIKHDEVTSLRKKVIQHEKTVRFMLVS